MGKAEELLEVMGAKDQMLGGFEAMLPVIDNMAVQFQLDAAAKAELREIYRSWFDEDLDQDRMIKEIAELYTSAFTVEELDQLIMFYKSPLGRKFLAKSPALMKEGAKIGMDEANRKQQNLLNRLGPFLKKHGIQ